MVTSNRGEGDFVLFCAASAVVGPPAAVLLQKFVKTVSYGALCRLFFSSGWRVVDRRIVGAWIGPAGIAKLPADAVLAELYQLLLEF